MLARDPSTCDLIRDRMAGLPGLTIAADCFSLAEAREVIHRHRPNLLVVDVRLLSSTDITRVLVHMALGAVVFVGDDSSRCRDMAEAGLPLVSSADPREAFQREFAELSRQPNLHRVGNTRAVIALLTGRVAARNRHVPLFLPDGLMFVDQRDVDFVRRQGARYCLLYSGGRRTRVAEPFERVAARLSGRQFVAASAELVVNVDHIRAVRIRCGEPGRILLHSGASFKLEDEYVSAVQAAVASRISARSAKPS